MTLLPPASLRKRINPDGAKSAGPLIHGWARRSSRGLVATPRHVRALVNYLPTADRSTYESLGGADTLEWANKAVDAIGPEETAPVAGDDEILVLGLPYGGPNGGKDSDEQYFSPRTDFMDGINDFPAVMYTHGTQNGFDPEPVGKVTARWYDRRGGWFKVKLDRTSPRYEQLKAAHSSRRLRASTGVVPASFSYDAGTGHIDTWLVGELSLVDTGDGYRPVNGYAITKADAVLFDDYYGDGVMAVGSGIGEIVGQLIAAIKQHLKDHTELQVAGDKIETLIESDGQMHEITGTPGFQDPLYKAEEKCSPDVMDADRDTAYLTRADDSPVEEIMDPIADTEEKCLPCEEAKRKADQFKAELAAPVKCARCPEAIDMIRGWVKAAKVAPAEAFTLMDRFITSDDGLDELVTEIEGRTSLGMSKARQDGLQLTMVNPITGVDPQSTIDPEHMAKQRRLAGLPAK